MDEHGFILKCVEAVTIQRPFDCIDKTVHCVVGIFFSNDIPFSGCPAVALFPIGRPSGDVKMMACHGTDLRINSGSQLLGGAE